jgi:hypothetical protein
VVSFPKVSPPKLYIHLSLPITCYVPRPSHYSLLDYPNKFGVECRSLRFSLCSFLHSAGNSSLSGPNIILSTLFINTLSLRSSVNVADHVLHPHKTSGKIMVLCISIFIFLDNKLKDKRFCKEWQKALLEYNFNMVKFFPNIWTFFPLKETLIILHILTPSCILISR